MKHFIYYKDSPCLGNTGRTISECTTLNLCSFFPNAFSIWEETFQGFCRGAVGSAATWETRV